MYSGVNFMNSSPLVPRCWSAMLNASQLPSVTGSCTGWGNDVWGVTSLSINDSLLCISRGMGGGWLYYIEQLWEKFLISFFFFREKNRRKSKFIKKVYPIAGIIREGFAQRSNPLHFYTAILLVYIRQHYFFLVQLCKPLNKAIAIVTNFFIYFYKSETALNFSPHSTYRNICIHFSLNPIRSQLGTVLDFWLDNVPRGLICFFFWGGGYGYAAETKRPQPYTRKCPAALCNPALD